jgi:hypothetical protein
VRVAELHPAGEGGEGPLLPPLVGVALGRRDDGYGALEDGDGVGVASQAAVDSGGDVEAHGELELRAVAAALEGARGPLGELEGARGAGALPGDHGVARLLEEEGPQIRVVQGGPVRVGPRRGLPGLGARGGGRRGGGRRPPGQRRGEAARRWGGRRGRGFGGGEARHGRRELGGEVRKGEVGGDSPSLVACLLAREEKKKDCTTGKAVSCGELVKRKRCRS